MCHNNDLPKKEKEYPVIRKKCWYVRSAGLKNRMSY